MFVNSIPRYEVLSEQAIDVIDRGWRRLVSEIGIEFLLPEAVEVLKDAGQTLEDENRIRFDPEFILEQVGKAPREPKEGLEVVHEVIPARGTGTGRGARPVGAAPTGATRG